MQYACACVVDRIDCDAMCANWRTNSSVFLEIVGKQWTIARAALIRSIYVCIYLFGLHKIFQKLSATLEAKGHQNQFILSFEMNFNAGTKTYVHRFGCLLPTIVQMLLDSSLRDALSWRNFI